MSWLLVSVALAAPPGFRVTKSTSDGCELSLGPSEAGVVPMHADCRWTDIDLATFRRVVGDWEAHADIFAVVVTSEVRRREAGRDLVHQRHRAKGIADREIFLWMSRAEVDGAHRYLWTRAVEEPLTPRDGAVAAARSDGYWQARADPEGGIILAHRLAYDPGGSVPGFLVRWFQTSGLERNLDDMHAALRRAKAD